MIDPIDLTLSILGAAGISVAAITLYLFAQVQIQNMRERIRELEAENTALAYTRFKEMTNG